jgi:GxxExxY protein
VRLLDEELTYAVIGSFLRVYNKLGDGFLENVYVGALGIELQKAQLHVEREVPVAIHYEGQIVGTYRVDLLVERRLILEVKAEVGPAGKFEKQLRNYLRCSELELGLLLIFGDKPIHRRVIHSRHFKELKPNRQ